MENSEIAVQIYEHVKSRILSGEWKEDTRVSERYLCDMFYTSRTTVRSAINRLKNDGWLYVRAKSGTYVSPVDIKSIRDNFEVRIILEPSMVLMAFPNITPDDIQRMKTNCVQMETASIEEYILTEADNHNVLKERCGNLTIVKIITDMMDTIYRITSKSAITAKRRIFSIREWRNVIQAIETQDVNMARQYMTQHIMNASDAFWETLNLK